MRIHHLCSIMVVLENIYTHSPNVCTCVCVYMGMCIVCVCVLRTCDVHGCVLYMHVSGMCVYMGMCVVCVY